MDTQYCHSTQGKVPPECIGPIWKSQGCTVNPKKSMVQGLSGEQIREKARQASSSQNPEEWKSCFGTSSQSGFGSKVSSRQSSLPSGCSQLLNPAGEIISCKDCGKMGGRGSEGIWLYKDAGRVWIPQCHCRTAVIATESQNQDNYNICGGTVSLSKPVDEEKDSCKLFQAWNDPATKWFHQGKDIVTGIEDDNTIFYSKNGSEKVYKTKGDRCRHTCNGQEVSICDMNKVKSCRNEEGDCLRIIRGQEKAKLKPKQIPAKCWYSIPVHNGLGPERTYMLGKESTKISGINCQDPYLYNFNAVDASLYLGDTKDSSTTSQYTHSLFLFKGNKYWKLVQVGDFLRRFLDLKVRVN